MRGILIDVSKRLIREVEVINNLDSIRVVVGCEYVQRIIIFGDHELWIDDEGLLHKETLPGGFMFGNNVYAGNGLILSFRVSRVSGAHESISSRLTLEEVAKWVKFVPRDMLPEPNMYVTGL